MTDVRKKRVRVPEQARAYAETEVAAMLASPEDRDVVPACAMDAKRFESALARAFIAGRRSTAKLATTAKKHKPDFCPECGELALESHVHCSGCKLVMRACTCQLELPTAN